MFKGLMFFLKFGWKIEKRYVVYLFINQFIGSGTLLVNIIMPKFIIDELVGLKRIEHIGLYVGAILLNNLLGNIVSSYLIQTSFRYRLNIFNEFELMMSKKTAEADYGKLEDPEFYDTKQKAYQFIYGNGRGFSYALDSAISIIGKVFVLIGIIAVISTLNIVIVVVFILLVILNALVESWSKKKTITLTLEAANVERKNSYYSNLFNDNLFAKEIRIFNLKDWLLGRYKSYLDEYSAYYDQQIGYHLKATYFNSITSFIQQGISYVYLVLQVVQSTITIGDFSMYLGTVATFSQAIRDVMSSLIDIRQYAPYYDAMNEYINIDSSMRTAGIEAFDNPVNTIEFKDVSFKYPGQERYALSNVSLKINSAEKISIVGENGSGKTTFVKLLMRLYDPTEGVILINGKNIKDFDYNEYLNLFSAVFQDYKLFAFSLRENISLANQD